MASVVHTDVEFTHTRYCATDEQRYIRVETFYNGGTWEATVTEYHDPQFTMLRYQGEHLNTQSDGFPTEDEAIVWAMNKIKEA